MAGVVQDRPTAAEAPPTVREHSTGELVKQASEQITLLVRQEMRLAQAEMAAKGKRFGLGGGMLGGAGVVALFALVPLVGAGTAALALVLPVWAAALVMFGALMLLAACMALIGVAQVKLATPSTPPDFIESVKADMEQIRERAHR
ncbi:hypothetical protein AQ490_15785 [Wenjunlia vitaminophila]|uniref:Phage holin family protein n=1 Tax=Wenjunlia vitaminophila TaxID=76728 RepID=A0A0T6LWV5_WENVI|nr:phage holin family protein [Wenjunlia vitaminophila]KRV50533.1 hypothetical protein AQ490_15785 [Wenjunlia vitaminophila]